jgi:nicotinamidase/pyrazinamidase
LDYCVKFSALDARQLSFNAHVIVDACRGITLGSGDLERALDEMKRAGATLMQSGDSPDK